MENEFIYFVVKYKDAKNNIRYKNVKMVDIDFSVIPEPNRSTLLKYINGDPNAAVFKLCSVCNDKKQLGKILLKGVYETGTYNRELLDVSVVCHTRYVDKQFMNGTTEADQNQAIIPIIYKECYRTPEKEKPYRSFEILENNVKEFNDVILLSKRVVKKLINAKYEFKNEKYEEFLKSIYYYIAEFYTNQIIKIRNAYDLYIPGSKYSGETERSGQIQACNELLDIKNQSVIDFIKAVVEGPQGNILYALNNSDSIAYYIFIANLLAQLRTFYLATYIDVEKVYPKVYSRVAPLYNANDELFVMASHDSLQNCFDAKMNEAKNKEKSR